MWKVITSSNLNPPLKLFFYSPILANNNMLLKIYYENIVVTFLNCHFLFFILFFLSFIHTFFSFFFFFLSCFSPSYPLPSLSSLFFFFPFLLDSRTFLSLSFINLERKAWLGTVNAVVNVSSRGERREKEFFLLRCMIFLK